MQRNYTQHPALESVDEKSQSGMGGNKLYAFCGTVFE